MQTHSLSHRRPIRLPTVPLQKRVVLACLEWLRARFDTWQRARRAAANRRELQSLDDRSLQDLGLDRSEIESWIRRGAADRRPRG